MMFNPFFNMMVLSWVFVAMSTYADFSPTKFRE